MTVLWPRLEEGFRTKVIPPETTRIRATIAGVSQGTKAIRRIIDINRGSSPRESRVEELPAGDYVVLAQAFNERNEVLADGGNKAVVQANRTTRAEIELIPIRDQETVAVVPEAVPSSVTSMEGVPGFMNPVKPSALPTPAFTPDPVASTVPKKPSRDFIPRVERRPIPTPTPLPTPLPPTGDIGIVINPVDGTSYTMGSVIPIEVGLKNAYGAERMAWFDGNNKLGEISWQPAEEKKDIRVIAVRDAKGNLLSAIDTTNKSLRDIVLTAKVYDGGDTVLAEETAVLKIRNLDAAPTPIPPPPPPNIVTSTPLNVTSSDFTSGVPITFGGTGLDQITSLTVNGISTTISAQTASSITVAPTGNVPSGIAASNYKVDVVSSYATGAATSKLYVGPMFFTMGGLHNTNAHADGAGSIARFDNPHDITILNGELYMTERVNRDVRKATGCGPNAFNHVQCNWTTLAGNHLVPAGFANGIGNAAIFHSPLGIDTDGVDIFVADAGNFCIRRINPTTGNTTTYTGSCTATGAVNGTLATSTFALVSGLEYVTSVPGALPPGTPGFVVTENIQRTVRRITATGVTLGFQTPFFPFPTNVKQPYAISVQDDGNARFLNEDDGRVHGALGGLTFFSNTIMGTGNGDNPGAIGTVLGTGIAAKFNAPRGIWTDRNGPGVGDDVIYYADTANHKIKTTTGTGVDVTYFAGDPTKSGTLTNGPLADLHCQNPYGGHAATVGGKKWIAYTCDGKVGIIKF